MGLKIDYIPGQTPIDDEEKDGLLIKSISTREELDEFEHQNIQSAIKWTIGKKLVKEEVLTIDFVNNLHKRMFGEVWHWAGKFRKTNKNIGIDRLQIPTQLQTLLDDCTYWIDHGTYKPDEIAVRFKHRIVSIHCYSNGNGRHSRLIGDLITNILKQPFFTWGSGADLAKDNETRAKYLLAIKKADDGNIAPLLHFART